jgi:hypothetical protein
MHLMHWDVAHPAGQPIPLRQPNPPVYYTVPEELQASGSQSPAMSCSDLSSEDSSELGGQWDPASRLQYQWAAQHQYPGQHPGQYPGQWPWPYQYCPPAHTLGPHPLY